MDSSAKEGFNVLSAILRTSSRYPDRIALRTPTFQLSYRVLRSMALSLAAHLRDSGLRAGEVVAIDADNPVYSLVTALAAGGLGAAWVHATREALSSPAVNIRFVLTDSKARHAGVTNVLRLDSEWLRLPTSIKGLPSLQFDGFLDYEQTFAIAQSSGTTGNSKLMAISARNAFLRSDPGNLLDHSDVPVAASFFHPLHQGNMWNILRVLRLGGTFLFGGGLESWLAWNATYVIGSPSHYLKEQALILAQDTARIDNAWIGGGPIYARQVKELLNMMRKIHVTFGASEAGIIATKTINRETWQDGPMRLGPIDPRCSAEVVGEDGIPLPQGREGKLRMKTPWTVKGYLGDREATQQFFRDGWFFTGDIGFIDRDGELVVTGRASEGVNIGGTKLNPALIDEIIIRHPAVADAICFVEKSEDLGDALSAVLRPRDQARIEICLPEIKASIAASFGASRVPIRYYETREMPRNENGKAMRLKASSLLHVYRRIE